MKKVLSIFLTAVMIFTMIPMAFAVDEVPEGYIGIYDVLGLYKIRNNLNGNYILMNNIDLSYATDIDGDYDIDGHGWNPIGRNDDNSFDEFSGIFDGNGYCIVGMRIEDNETNSFYYGLFGKVSGTVKNLDIVDADINTISSYRGAVAGYVSGNIENVNIVGANISAGGTWCSLYRGDRRICRKRKY